MRIVLGSIVARGMGLSRMAVTQQPGCDDRGAALRPFDGRVETYATGAPRAGYRRTAND